MSFRKNLTFALPALLAALMLCSTFAVRAESIPSTGTPDIKDPTVLWGWNQAWGLPWGSRATCAAPYHFVDGTGGNACAKFAEDCHPNKGQPGYSPFSSGPGCATYTADGRYAGSGGSWSECEQGYVLVNGKCSGTKYGCPSTGGWSLSADKLSCVREDCDAGTFRDQVTGLCSAEKGLGEACPAGD